MFSSCAGTVSALTGIVNQPIIFGIFSAVSGRAGYRQLLFLKSMSHLASSRNPAAGRLGLNGVRQDNLLCKPHIATWTTAFLIAALKYSVVAKNLSQVGFHHILVLSEAAYPSCRKPSFPLCHRRIRHPS
jgi:hypothetical protein